MLSLGAIQLATPNVNNGGGGGSDGISGILSKINLKSTIKFTIIIFTNANLPRI